MKKLLSFVSAAVVASFLLTGLAVAKPAWKKDTGAANCGVCHLEDKKADNSANKLYKDSKDMAVKMKAGKGDFAGKTSCNDCHKGKMKP